MLLIVEIAGVIALSVPQGEVREAVQRVYGQRQYQTDLPHDLATGAGGGSPRRFRPSDGSIRARREFELPDLPRLPDIGIFLVYAALIVVGILAAVAFARFLASRGSRAQAEASIVSAERAPPSVATDSFPDPQALAREGRFEEAIHALLLIAIARLRESSPVKIRSSLTSRELVGALPLADEPKEALRQLVHAVELLVFGGRSAGALEFERSLAQYERLGFA